MSTTYRHGDYNVQCDFSGFKVKRSECRFTWDGHLVHKRFWEARHPQDFVRGVPDNQGVRDARPQGEESFVSVTEVTPESL